MSIHLAAIAFLALAFVLTTLKPINLGVICLAGVFLIGGIIGGLPGDALYAGFPANLFVLLVGVTLLFNIASENGTIDWLIGRMVRAVRGSNTMVPWVMFGITGLFSAIGNAYAVPIMAPIALRYAARNGISETYMGLMVIHGCLAGALSPISLYGLIIHGILIDNGIPSNQILLFATGFAANIAIAICIHVISLMRGLHNQPVEVESTAHAEAQQHVGPDGSHATASASGAVTNAVGAGNTRPIRDDAESSGSVQPFGVEQLLSLSAIAALILGSLVFGADIGLLAIILSFVLALFKPHRLRPALRSVPWEVVLLVCGVLTYVGVMRELGTIDFVGNTVSSIGLPLVAALLLGYVGAVISAFATSSGVITALVPLAMPLLAGSDISAFAVIALLGVTSTIVDVSPFSTNGAIVVANAVEKNQPRVLRSLIFYGGFIVLAAPPLVWAVLVLPTTF